MSWPWEGLRQFGYDLILADPAWDFENYSAAGTKKGADPHYTVMPLDGIKALRVDLLAQRDCLLLLWATACMLPQALEVMTAWRFTYKTELTWRKVTPNGKVRMGTGYRARTMHEPLLLGTIGNPKHRAFPSIFDGVAREHSRKPDEAFAMIDTCCPYLFARCELFARQRRNSWTSWGDQLDHFTASENPAVQDRASPPRATSAAD